MDTQIALNKEFSRLKSEAQSIIRFKEITMLPCKTPYELDLRLKCTICEANMTLIDGKPREWFVTSLMVHLRNALSQQRLTNQVEALEITMKLHETSI